MSWIEDDQPVYAFTVPSQDTNVGTVQQGKLKLKDKVLLNDTWVHPEAKLKAKTGAKAKASPPKVAEATFERSMLNKQMIYMLDGTTMMRLKMSNGSMTQRKKSGRRILLPLLGVYPPSA